MTMYCIVCGTKIKRWIHKKIISDDLAREWKLTKDQRNKFDLRESRFCPKCKNSSRTRALAEAIIKTIPFKGTDSFLKWKESASNAGLKIAEINSCGNLHKILKKIPNLAYSEYQPSLIDKKLLTTIKNIVKKILYRYAHEDINQLSYKSGSFDLVLHSETLEHIVTVNKAIKETRRILKPGGYCIFTVPIIPERLSKQKARLNKNSIFETIENPSYHGFGNRSDYLVCWEFGGNFIKKNKLITVVAYPEYMTWVFALKK